MKTGFVLFLAVSTLFMGCVEQSTPDKKVPASAITQAGFLSTNGKNIVNSNGDNVYLRGVNVGGWLVQEQWMCPVLIHPQENMRDHKTMLDTLKERFGAEVRDELIAVYEDNYWTETDFDNCASMGMSVIRLPFSYMNLVILDEGPDFHKLKPNAFSRFDWFVEEAGKRGIYVILDMHGAFGSQNGKDHSGEINDGWQLYNDQANMQKTIWLWGEIAKHFNGNPVVAMYDILNEPGPQARTINHVQWNLFDKIYTEIRKHDPSHIISMESCWDAVHLPRPEQYSWKNVVYQYHYYDWNNITNAEGLNGFTDSKIADIDAGNYNVPTFVGEFTYFDQVSSWDYALNVFNQQGWHWTSLSYKVMQEMGSWGIYHHNPQRANIQTDTEQQIREKWSMVGAEYAKPNPMIKSEIEKKTPYTLSGGSTG